MTNGVKAFLHFAERLWEGYRLKMSYEEWVAINELIGEYEPSVVCKKIPMWRKHGRYYVELKLPQKNICVVWDEQVGCLTALSYNAWKLAVGRNFSKPREARLRRIPKGKEANKWMNYDSRHLTKP